MYAEVYQVGRHVVKPPGHQTWLEPRSPPQGVFWFLHKGAVTLPSDPGSSFCLLAETGVTQPRSPVSGSLPSAEIQQSWGS